jgi:hypothetical protein
MGPSRWRTDVPVLGVPSFTADADAGLYAIDQASYVPADCPAA